MKLKHLNRIIMILIGSIVLISCEALNSYKYENALNKDKKWIRKDYDREIEHSMSKESTIIEELYYKRMDYAQFRYQFYTNVDFQNEVTKALNDSDKYQYNGNYYKLTITSEPPKYLKRAKWTDLPSNKAKKKSKLFRKK